MSSEQVKALLPSRLERLTSATVSSRAQLLAELEQVREDGVAFDREEHTEGICAVGVSLDLDSTAAISVPVPAQRFYGRERELATAVRAAGETAAMALS